MAIPVFDPMYGQDVQPTFGPDVPSGYPGSGLLPMQGPVLPPDFGPDYSSEGYQSGVDPMLSLHTDLGQSRKTLMDAILAQGDVPPMRVQPPPGISGLQAGLAGGLGLIAAASGPHGNGAGVAQTFVQGAMGQNDRRFQAAMENMKAARESEIQRKRLRAQVAQLDYEDKAREYGQQAAFRHQDAMEGKRAERELAVASAKTEGQIRLRDRMLAGDPDAILTEQYMKGAITREQWLDGIAKVGPAKAGQLGAQANMQNATAEFKRRIIDPTVAKLGAEKAALMAHAREWSLQADTLAKRLPFVPEDMQASIAEKEARAFAAKMTASASMVRATRTDNAQARGEAKGDLARARMAAKAKVDHWESALKRIDDLYKNGYYGEVGDKKAVDAYDAAREAANTGWADAQAEFAEIKEMDLPKAKAP